jgi:processive 1,2-diacylglycerol beta-glucosyltransferase
MRHALILSGRFGKGHDTVAEASAGVLSTMGIDSRIVDSIALLGGPGSVAGDRVFRTLLSNAPVYDAFHFSQLRAGSRLARLLDRAAQRTMYPHFLREVDRTQPDLLLSVFATGAAASARYKAEHRDVTSVVFITDSYAHRLWVHDQTDLFIVTSELCAHAVRSHRPAAAVVVVTHPTRPAFYDPPSQATARTSLGVPGDARCVLLMSGAWGIGPVAQCARALAAAGVWVLAVAGSNERLGTRLRAAAATDPKIIVFGYTDRIAELMAASDAVITSSGDTCREARVVGRGLVLLDVVPGHGRENLNHELELGGAVVALPTPSLVVGAVDQFFEHRRNEHVNAEPNPRRWERELRDALATVGLS